MKYTIGDLRKIINDPSIPDDVEVIPFEDGESMEWNHIELFHSVPAEEKNASNCCLWCEVPHDDSFELLWDFVDDILPESIKNNFKDSYFEYVQAFRRNESEDRDLTTEEIDKIVATLRERMKSL